MEGARLERALRRLEGVRDATVNAPRERVTIEVDRLPRLEPILRMLGARGYTVAIGQVQVATWIAARRVRLLELRSQLLDFPAVMYCRAGCATGRLDFGLELGENWEVDVRRVCTWLCRTVEQEVGGESPDAGHAGAALEPRRS